MSIIIYHNQVIIPGHHQAYSSLVSPAHFTIPQATATAPLDSAHFRAKVLGAMFKRPAAWGCGGDVAQRWGS